jgi:tetratricopeptide (TPR) repeat protein
MGDDRLERAGELYERAVFGGEVEGLAVADGELDRVEADLALARGKVAHARFLLERQEDPGELGLFTRARELYRAVGNERGEAEACFWVGTFHQVLRGDHETALPELRRSRELAIRTGDRLTLSYAVRHLGFAAMAGGDLHEAERLLTESVELRRELGFTAGVAAGLLALAELAATAGDERRAHGLLDEATEVAKEAGAAGILRWIEAGRAELSTR